MSQQTIHHHLVEQFGQGNFYVQKCIIYTRGQSGWVRYGRIYNSVQDPERQYVISDGSLIAYQQAVSDRLDVALARRGYAGVL